jgi:hypothetical protein
MITALGLALTLSLGAGSADELTATTVGPLKLRVPAAWEKRNNEGSTRYAAPSGEAYFDLDVSQVKRKGGMPAEECLQKIVDGLGVEGARRLTIGGQPAAVTEHLDRDEDGKEFRQLTYVGCNGVTTWSLQFHLVEARKARFLPVADKVARSIVYR